MVDRFMEVYDKRVTADKDELKQKQLAEAADGWTLVMPNKKSKGVKRLRLPSEEESPAKKVKLHPMLYQGLAKKSAQQKRLDLLKQKFAEEKEKIKRIRAQRKFQP